MPINWGTQASLPSWDISKAQTPRFTAPNLCPALFSLLSQQRPLPHGTSRLTPQECGSGSGMHQHGMMRRLPLSSQILWIYHVASILKCKDFWDKDKNNQIVLFVVGKQRGAGSEREINWTAQAPEGQGLVLGLHCPQRQGSHSRCSINFVGRKLWEAPAIPPLSPGLLPFSLHSGVWMRSCPKSQEC